MSVIMASIPEEEEAMNDDILSKARLLNEAGNYDFKAGNLEQAKQSYTESLEYDGTNAAVYANRCAVFMKEMNYELALQDAMKAVEIAPEWWKAYFRLGQVYNLMQVYQESLTYFKKAHYLNPSRDDLKDAVAIVESKIQDLEANKIQKSLETIPEDSPPVDNPEESVTHRMEVVKYLRDHYAIQPNDHLLDIRKRAEQSEYFQQLLIAEHHFCEAMYMLIKLVDLDRLPFLLCEKFVEEFSAGLKMEVSSLKMPFDLANRACSILKHVLPLGTTFHEDACICYVSLEVHSWLSVVEFLRRCIRRYPGNPYFLHKRAKLLPCNLRYTDALKDITAAIRLHPSKYQYWYCRAEIMQELYPQVPVEAAIEAFDEFLHRAPTEDHHVAFAYYHLSTLCKKMTVSNGALADQAVQRHYHEAAVKNTEMFNAAEERQIAVLYAPVRKQFFEYFV